MLYVYVLILPLVILILFFLIKKGKLIVFHDYIVFLLKYCGLLLVYILLLNYLYHEQNLETGYSTITLTIILIPISFISLLIHILLLIKKSG
jgi:hypothetical protein